MAKGQKRSGREPKKPKRNKLKVAPPATALSRGSNSSGQIHRGAIPKSGDEERLAG